MTLSFESTHEYYLKDAQKTHVEEQLKEIHDSLTEYFAEKSRKELEESIGVK